MSDNLPSVFIGSSSEGLDVAREVELQLQRDALTTIWKDGVFRPGDGTLEKLMNAVHQFDFAIMVLTPDDLTESRFERSASPRDNVIFELGLFMGRLGRSRTFVVHEENVNLKLPSDLTGITVSAYRRRENLSAALSPACTPIIRSIQTLSHFQGSTRHHDEPSLGDKVVELRNVLRENNFLPDIIIGIPRGGLAVGALLSKQISEDHVIPVVSLCPLPDFDNRFNHIEFGIDDFPTAPHPIKILIVDDICRSGRTLSAAQSYLENYIDTSHFEIRTAVISYYDREYSQRIDPHFWVETPKKEIRDFAGYPEPYAE